MDGVTYTITDSAGARQLTDDVRNLYAAVYAEAPYHEGPEHVRQFRRWWSDHLRRPGFALASATEASRLVGVSYGYTMPGGDWVEPNADEPPALLRAAEKLLVPEWMVAGDYRGSGVGRRLLSMLLNGRSEPYAVLAANPHAPARRLYERMGWRQYGQIRPKSIPDMDVLVLRISALDPP
ncbi:GNAT family N-acetyltransferase [Salinispora fenicalii]|uniref:GNAT family N-acetyltransferase n=1 Tax=Salinispora fenicalii TaxID=1137263 RepID=UPI0004842CF6|nr:GNAT family N-acetyltransferase [Salinispora fenicalii]